jgi:hypothetical protein
VGVETLLGRSKLGHFVKAPTPTITPDYSHLVCLAGHHVPNDSLLILLRDNLLSCTQQANLLCNYIHIDIL